MRRRGRAQDSTEGPDGPRRVMRYDNGVVWFEKLELWRERAKIANLATAFDMEFGYGRGVSVVAARLAGAVAPGRSGVV